MKTIPQWGGRWVYVSRGEVVELLARAALDPAFLRDLRAATGATVEEL